MRGLGRALDNALHALDQVHRAALQEAVEGGVTALSRAEAEELLRRHTVGRFAYVARAGAPDVVPVNDVWSDGAVLVRSGPGPKLRL